MATLDILIRNGRIIDGTGNVWYRGDVGVQDGRIAVMGKLGDLPATQVIDAQEMIVCPGFVDIHTHANIYVIAEPLNQPRLRQGITTILVGLCGNSTAPLTERSAESIADYLKTNYGEFGAEWTWRSLGDYLARIDGNAAVNVASNFGITNLWVDAVGWKNRRATQSEIERMKELAAEAMEDGAVGFSTGTYAPSEWYAFDEALEVAKVVAAYGGVYFSHVRTLPSDDPLAGHKEAIDIGEKAGLGVHIEHFKTHNEQMYNRAPDMLEMVDAARARGVDVTIESYPYPAGSGSLYPPTWTHEGGPDAMMARLRDPAIAATIVDELNRRSPDEWDRRQIAGVKLDRYKWIEGKRVGEAAATAGQSVGEFLVELMRENELRVAHVSYGGNEDDIRTIMQHPAHMVGSDSIHIGSKLHPRTYGCHARYLGRYVRELGILRLEQCIRMMTSLPARRIGLLDRGLLRPGMAADITVFDPNRIIDHSTFEEPTQYAEGVAHVVVNGVLALKDGEPTGATPGRGLKRQDSLRRR